MNNDSKNSISHEIVMRFLISQNVQDYLTNEELIESNDDDANQEEAQFMKKGENQQRVEESACGRKLQ